MNASRFCVSVALAATAAAASVSAQNLYAYGPNGGTSWFQEECLPSPAWAGGGPGVPVGAMAAPNRPLLAMPRGAVAVDNLAGVVYSTNGANWIDRTTYARLGCAGGVVLAPLPIPGFVNRVTGMAVDPATKHLYVTNGAMIWRLNPLAGMAIVCSFGVAPAAAVHGLDIDPLTGHVFAVSNAGDVVEYGACGGVIAFSPLTYAWPGSPTTGIALDRSGAAGGVAYVLHANGNVYDHPGAALYQNIGAGHVGMTYLASPIHLPVTAACGGVQPEPRVSALAVQGSAGFGIDLCNLPAGTASTVLMIHFAFAFPPVAIGGGWWIPGAPIAILVPVPAGATTAHQGLPLPAGTAGFRFYSQWGQICPATGALLFSDAMQITIAR